MCPIRFSRASLSSDTSVTTLEFTDDGTDLGIQAVITGTSRRLVRSTSELNLSPDGDCSIDSFEILHGSSWQELNSTGFELSQQGSETHLTVSSQVAPKYFKYTSTQVRTYVCVVRMYACYSVHVHVHMYRYR